MATHIKCMSTLLNRLLSTKWYNISHGIYVRFWFEMFLSLNHQSVMDYDLSPTRFRVMPKTHQVPLQQLWGPFHKLFSIITQVWWTFHLQIHQNFNVVIAHGTAAVLSWHLQNFVAIWSPAIEKQLNEISVEFELWWKIVSEMGCWANWVHQPVTTPNVMTKRERYIYIYFWDVLQIFSSEKGLCWF